MGTFPLTYPATAGDRPPEVRLLLCCARTEVDSQTAEKIQDLVEGPLDWAVLLHLADEHMVLPLVHRALSAVAPNAVPSPVQDRLRSAFHAHVRNNLLLSHELLDLLSLFEEHGVSALPFKGPVAALSGYGDLKLRPFGDLDLLLHLEDVPQAEDLLLDRQFEDWETLPPLPVLDFNHPPSWRAALTQPFSKAKTYVREDGRDIGIFVELHWELVPPYFRHPLDAEQNWERLRTVSLLDTRVQTFSPEDTLFHFCLHGTLHRWRQLRLVCDIAEYLHRHRQLDWSGLFDHAQQLHSERLFLLGLRLAHDLLDAPLPPIVQRRLDGNSAVASLATRCEEHLFGVSSGARRILDTFAYDLQVRDRIQDGIGLCIGDAVAALPTYLRDWWQRPRGQ